MDEFNDIIFSNNKGEETVIVTDPKLTGFDDDYYTIRLSRFQRFVFKLKHPTIYIYEDRS